MHHPTDRIAHTTAFVTPVVEHWLEREIALPNKPAIAGTFVVFTFIRKNTHVIEAINKHDLNQCS